MKLLVRLLTVFILAGCCRTVSAQAADTLEYTRQELKIRVRDGVHLNTVIFSPKSKREAFPFIFLRTPYGVSDQGSPNLNSYVQDLALEGYIFVFQDIRGRYKSEGVFEMQRFSRDKKDPNSIDESSDTYDVIDWLVKNIPNNNGKAGMMGISYDGWTTMMGTLDPHPALKAASEQATPSDMFLGDDFHHNGAFRLSYAFEYAYMEEATKEDAHFDFDDYDTYDWYLKLGPLSNINERYVHHKLPSWDDFIKHPNNDDFWKRQSLPYRLKEPTVPNLHVAGWWDQEDFYGPLKAYEVLEKKDLSHKNYLVIGPWNHGGWAGGKKESLGNIKFGTPTAEKFRKELQAPWFAWHLKGKGDGKFSEAVTFQTGANTWKNYEQWPPLSTTVQKNLYFHPNGRLSFDTPSADTGFASWISDPAHPVPYRNRPIEATYSPGSRWYTWLLEDQRFVSDRPDVVAWQTDVLTDDITVTGNLLAELFASTSGTDSDWIVKFIDVYPARYPDEPRMSGYQLMVANDVFRGRFRKSFEKPEPLQPGVPAVYSIDLHAVNHVFKKGHRIMVQLQSTWFPIIDRNPQKFVTSIFEAEEADYQKAEQRVYFSKSLPSNIKLPVAK